MIMDYLYTQGKNVNEFKNEENPREAEKGQQCLWT